MHSYLISGGTSEKRNEWIARQLNQWEVGKFDISEMARQDSSIGISHVRDFQKKLYLKPNSSPYSVGIIRQAETLTIEAQNALLKTLEEPPPHARVILESPTADVFLPTVLSRCHLINLGTHEQFTQEELLQCFKTIEQIVSAPIGKRLKLLDNVAENRNEAAAWIDLAIATARHEMLVTNGAPNLLRSLLKARQHLSANVNYKLVIDNIFLYN